MSKKIVLLFLILCFFHLFIPFLCLAKMVSIAGDEVNMRKGPSTKHEVKWVLGKGFPLQVIASQGKWLKVKDFENDVGWVYAPLTTGIPSVVVKSKIVNMRSGPGTNYRIIGKAAYGVVFKTVKRTKSWVKVRHASGKTGWVSRRLLWGW